MWGWRKEGEWADGKKVARNSCEVVYFMVGLLVDSNSLAEADCFGCCDAMQCEDESKKRRKEEEKDGCS